MSGEIYVFLSDGCWPTLSEWRDVARSCAFKVELVSVGSGSMMLSNLRLVMDGRTAEVEVEIVESSEVARGDAELVIATDGRERCVVFSYEHTFAACQAAIEAAASLCMSADGILWCGEGGGVHNSHSVLRFASSQIDLLRP